MAAVMPIRGQLALAPALVLRMRAQQQALETAEAKLAASFGMSSLSPEQVSQVNALLDARK